MFPGVAAKDRPATKAKGPRSIRDGTTRRGKLFILWTP